MTQDVATPLPPAGVAETRALKFQAPGPFQAELRRRVDVWFEATGRSRRDCPEMYLKSAIVLATTALLYVSLLWFATAWWQALPLAILLGAAVALIGFNIQHDGGHQGYSDRPWVNKFAALTMDVIGASSYVWRWKHGVFHHTFTNIVGHDTDIDLGVFGRTSPHQARLSHHRWQHWYLWPLYGLMLIRWELYTDFHAMVTSRIEGRRIPRAGLRDWLIFLVGKAVYLFLAFGLPMLQHPILNVLGLYFVFTMTVGLVISVVFQLAHCVEEADFPAPSGHSGDVENAWMIHQVETTVDFARQNRVISWLLGGLNFQIEHHLFPRICHIHYPALSRIVEQTCRDYGVRYYSHPTFWAGVQSHYRWLRRMGREEERAAA